MFLERCRCEHQLCGFAIQSQLFWDSLNWLAGCPTDISTGCVLKCFGWWYLRKSGLNSIFFIFIILWAARCTYIIYANSWITPPRAFFFLHTTEMKILPFATFALIDKLLAIGRLDGHSWLAGLQEGDERMPGEHWHRPRLHIGPHCGNMRGGRESETKREREREKSETPSSRSIWVSQTANRR